MLLVFKSEPAFKSSSAKNYSFVSITIKAATSSPRVTNLSVASGPPRKHTNSPHCLTAIALLY